MTPKTIALAAALLLCGGAFAVPAATPPGTPADPHPDSPTSLLRKAQQGSDASGSGNTGPAATAPASSEPSATASTSKSGKHAPRKSKKRRAIKPAA